jgi:hypothetical protein
VTRKDDDYYDGIISGIEQFRKVCSIVSRAFLLIGLAINSFQYSDKNKQYANRAVLKITLTS